MTTHKKTTYVDGHEREDVVKDRARYVVEIRNHAEYMCSYGKAYCIFSLHSPALMNRIYGSCITPASSLILLNLNRRQRKHGRGHAAGAGDKKHKPGVVVVSREGDNTYTLRFPSDDVVSGVSVASMQVSVATYKKGPVPAALVGHSKGAQQILLERGVIAETSKLNGKCGTADRKKREAR